MTKLSSNSALPMLVATSDGALVTTTAPQRIAMRMAENLLGEARRLERLLVAQQSYCIGDYEFREADFAQIQLRSAAKARSLMQVLEEHF